MRSPLRRRAVWLVLAGAVSAAAAPQADVGPITQALRAGRYDQALRRLEPALEARPQDAGLWTLRGVALARLGRTDESLRSYRRALKLSPGFLAALQGAAEVEYQSRRPEARETLAKVLAADPRNATAHAMLAALAYERQDCAAAAGHFEAGRAVVEANASALWQFGHCLFALGRPQDAAAVFERLAAMEPANDQVRFNAALCLYQTKRYRDAVAALQPLAQAKLPEGAVLSLLADAYEAEGRVPEAIAVLQRAISLYPRDEGHYLSLAALCLKHESHELGLEIAGVGLRNVPASARLHAMRAAIRAQLGDFADAQADFEQAARLDPGQPGAAVGLSLTMQRTGRLEESIELLRAQVSQRPRDPAVNLLLAQALMRRDLAPDAPELVEARQALLRTIEAEPELARARVELGKLFLKTGDDEKAIDELRRALALDSSDRRATYQLLVALRRAGRMEETPRLVERLRALMEQEREAEAQRSRIRLVRAAPADARD